MNVLEVDSLNVSYGDVRVLWDVTLHVGETEVVTLIGSNGAGKTTFMRTVSGIVKAQSGRVAFDGMSLDGLEPHQIVRLGLAQVPQGRHLFLDLTVSENLELGAYVGAARGEGSGGIEDRLEEVYRDFDILYRRRRQKAGLLSGGEQQMLALGRALLTRPKMLLLDEPSAGLAPVIVGEVARSIKRLREKKGLTVLIVEQNARLALGLADRGYVLETGRVMMSGSCTDLATSDAVRRAYLGM